MYRAIFHNSCLKASYNLLEKSNDLQLKKDLVKKVLENANIQEHTLKLYLKILIYTHRLA